MVHKWRTATNQECLDHLNESMDLLGIGGKVERTNKYLGYEGSCCSTCGVVMFNNVRFQGIRTPRTCEEAIVKKVMNC